MKRIGVTLALLSLVAVTGSPPVAAQKHGAGTARLQLVEATVEDILKALQTKLITSEQLVEMYLARIDAFDDAGPGVNAFIHVNENGVERRGNSTPLGIRVAPQPTLRHTGGTEGHHRHRGHAHHRRVVDPRGLDAAERRVHHAEAARRRRHHHRQADAHRVRQLHSIGMPPATAGSGCTDSTLMTRVRYRAATGGPC